jgi:hypothetical protein
MLPLHTVLPCCWKPPVGLAVTCSQDAAALLMSLCCRCRNAGLHSNTCAETAKGMSSLLPQPPSSTPHQYASSQHIPLPPAPPWHQTGIPLTRLAHMLLRCGASHNPTQQTPSHEHLKAASTCDDTLVLRETQQQDGQASVRYNSGIRHTVSGISKQAWDNTPYPLPRLVRVLLAPRLFREPWSTRAPPLKAPLHPFRPKALSCLGEARQQLSRWPHAGREHAHTAGALQPPPQLGPAGANMSRGSQHHRLPADKTMPSDHDTWHTNDKCLGRLHCSPAWPSPTPHATRPAYT